MVGLGVPPMPKRIYAQMAAAFQEEHGKPTDQEAPGHTLVETTAAMIDNGDPQAESLTNVTSKEDGEDVMTIAHSDTSGAMKQVQRKIKTVPLPVDPEELRTRYKVLENNFLYTQFKFSNIEWLRDCHKGTFAGLADYLLGTKVMKLPALKDQGKTVEWATLLRYELAIRKKAMEFVKDDGLGLATALRKAMQDEETRALYFTSYISTGAGTKSIKQRERSRSRGRERDTRKSWKGKGAKGTKAQDTGKNNNTRNTSMPSTWEPRYRGNRGGKQKGSAKGGFTVVSKTPDRQLICYAFNTEGKTCDGQCGMIHCCRVLGCYSTTHPMFKHPGWKSDQA